MLNLPDDQYHSQEHGIWYNCLRTQNLPLCTIYALYISIAEMLAVTWSDGSLALYTVKADTGAADCLTLPPDAAVAAMDWSPKGKQLVVVRANCDLVQYKPDFSVAKYPKLQEMKTVKGECGIHIFLHLSKIIVETLSTRPIPDRSEGRLRDLAVHLRVPDRSAGCLGPELGAAEPLAGDGQQGGARGALQLR